MPMTRSRGKPDSFIATWHITSSGLDTTTMMLLGATRLISRATDPTMPALVLTRSSRLMPGFRAIPAVTTKSSAPAASS
ncbi:hypothetical protein D3C83_104750 [compost metagenome]